MSTMTELDTYTCVRVGRARTLHLPRVDIKGGQVAVHTHCDQPLTTDEWRAARVGIPTCPACIQQVTT